ncbi:MarR family winged helix-turn-helix transcriptional regulator [Pseudooceanicola sp.]|uniref:MarR family winged helix-turn-helix transcriptional regulator n=1 Tax=Pseudooceanicola sp. TaxID=1914328 RepID=UPI0035C72471
MFAFEDTLPHWINRLSFQIRSEAQKAFTEKGIDLTPEEWAILMVIWSRGPQRMTELAATTFRDRTTVTRMIDRLVRKGLIERQSSADDRRTVRIAVTPVGAAFEPEVMSVITPLIARAMAGVTAEDASRVLAILRQVSANLDAPGPPVSGDGGSPVA